MARLVCSQISLPVQVYTQTGRKNRSYAAHNELVWLPAKQGFLQRRVSAK